MEVGARGYTALSLTACLRALGFRNLLLRSCLSDVGDEALRRSFWIWFLREKEVWGRVGCSSVLINIGKYVSLGERGGVGG